MKTIKCPECYQPVGKDCDNPKFMVDPIGMFHCQGCGVMQVAGLDHIDCPFCDGKGYIKIEEE